VSDRLTLEVPAASAGDVVLAWQAEARRSLDQGDTAAALDRFVELLGLALQVGPESAMSTLHAIVGAARDSVGRGQADLLAALGPALADLVSRLRHSQAAPSTPEMDAWCTAAEEVGALIGQVGLLLDVRPDGRSGLLALVRTRGLLLEEATGGLLGVTDLLNETERSGPAVRKTEGI